MTTFVRKSSNHTYETQSYYKIVGFNKVRQKVPSRTYHLYNGQTVTFDTVVCDCCCLGKISKPHLSIVMVVGRFCEIVLILIAIPLSTLVFSW